MAASSDVGEVELMLCGDANSGKTTFITRIVKGNAGGAAPIATPDDQGFHVKDQQIAGKSFRIKTWDSAGEERFRHLTTAAYRKSEGYFVLFDLAEEESFNNLKEWVGEVSRFGAQSNPVVYIVGNKLDLPRVISRAQGEAAATQYKGRYFEASALRGDNVEDIYNEMVQAILKTRQEKEAAKAKADEKPKTGLRKQTSADGGKSGCCILL